MVEVVLDAGLEDLGHLVRHPGVPPLRAESAADNGQTASHRAYAPNLGRPFQRRPRIIKVVYLYRSRHEDAFARCDWLRLHCELPTYDWDNVRFKIYETDPSLFAETV